jgi:hypothetical protein
VRLFYFVGGPVAGRHEAFRRRLAEVGGSPPGWTIYPHATGDGRALHVVEADGEDAVLAHLRQFDPDYAYGTIVEVVRASDAASASRESH